MAKDIQGNGELLRTLLDNATENAASTVSDVEEDIESSAASTVSPSSEDSRTSSRRSVSYNSSQSDNHSSRSSDSSSMSSEELSDGHISDNIDEVNNSMIIPIVADSLETGNNAAEEENVLNGSKCCRNVTFDEGMAIDEVAANNWDGSGMKVMSKKRQKKKSKRVKFNNKIMPLVTTGSTKDESVSTRNQSSEKSVQNSELSVVMTNESYSRWRRHNSGPVRRLKKVIKPDSTPVSHTLYPPEPASNDDKLQLKYLELMQILKQNDRNAYKDLQFKVKEMYGDKVSKFMPLDSREGSYDRLNYSNNKHHEAFEKHTKRKCEVIKTTYGRVNSNKEVKNERPHNMRRSRSNLNEKYRQLQELLMEEFENESESPVKSQLRQTIDVVKSYQEQLSKLEDAENHSLEVADSVSDQYKDSTKTTSIDGTSDMNSEHTEGDAVNSNVLLTKRVTFYDGQVEVASVHQNSSSAKTNNPYLNKQEIAAKSDFQKPRLKGHIYGSDNNLATSDNVTIKEWLMEKDRQARQERVTERIKKREKRRLLAEKAARRLEREEEAHRAMVSWLEEKSKDKKLEKQREKKEKERQKKQEERKKKNKINAHDLECRATQNDPLTDKKQQQNHFEYDSDCTCGFAEAQKLRQNKETNSEIARNLSRGGQPRSSYYYQKPKLSKKKVAQKAMEEEKHRRSEQLKKRIAYDQWLKEKRTDSLKQKEKHKSETLSDDDSEYVKIIPGLARERFDKILKNKKQVDSGLPDVDTKANSYPKGKSENNKKLSNEKNYVWKNKDSKLGNQGNIPHPPSQLPRSPRVVKSRATKTPLPNRHCAEVVNGQPPKDKGNTTTDSTFKQAQTNNRPSSAPSNSSSQRSKWNSPTPLRQSAEEQRRKYAEDMAASVDNERPEPQGCDGHGEYIFEGSVFNSNDGDINAERQNEEDELSPPPPPPPGKKRVSFGASKLIYTTDDTPSSGSSDEIPEDDYLDAKSDGGNGENLHEVEDSVLNKEGFFMTSFE